MSDLKYDTKLSFLYHKKREKFFAFFDSLTKIISLLAVSSLVLASGLENVTKAAIAGISVLLTILSICYDFSGNASLHKFLAARFAALRTKLNQDFPQDALQAEFFSIQEDEPPVLTGLVQLCQDEIEYANGCAVAPERLTVRRRLITQFGGGSYPEMDQHA